MKANRKIALPHRLLVALLSASLVLPAPGSDHADPQNVLNPFEMRQQQEANITDLHAFVVDKDWKVITRQPDAALGDQLILSLCVRRALTEKREKLPDRPSDSTQLMVDGFTFRIHLDLSPPVRFFDEEAAKREAGVREGDAAALAKFMADTNDARALQFRYGGIIERPSDIAEEAGLEFRLRYDRGNGRPDGDAVTIEHKRLTGAWTGPRAMHEVKGDGKPVGKLINVQAGIFDDPFIFPRFFRRNVVGIVTSIPLDRLPAVPKATKERPLVLWATTHDREGKQIDHVGRSLRTQLPRFGYLNTLPPAQHRTAIQRVHENPTLVEDFSRTFISVLIGRRHYDDVPDVMIYDLMRPAKFPNGRSFPDDVARALAEGGETLLLELSYVESEQFPRATVNDKPFLPDFPYLAKRWTNAEIAAARPGVTMAISDGSIIARPYDALGEVRDPAMFAPATKRKLWALGVLGVLGILALVAGLVWLGFHLGKHHARNKAGQPDDEGQGLTTGEEDALKPEAEEPPPAADALYIERPEGSSYAEVHKFVISQEFSRPYDPGKLPTEGVSFWTLASGLLPWGKPSLLTRAIRRTLKTRTDLRWGKNGDGVTRLIHPNGICLAGKWIIEGIDGGHGKEPAPTGYTGWFEKGRQGFIIARWSPSRAETRRGHWRSMGLVAKIWPTIDINDTRVVHSASLITQEDLGGTNVQNVNDVDLRNAPDIHSWQRRGGLPGLLLTGIFFRLLNVNATIRQLHEIAELHHPTEEPVKHPRCPQLIRLKVLNRDIIAGGALDVREEILAHLRSGKFELSIEVSDHDPHGDAVRITDAYIERNIPEDAWRRIGRIEFTEGMCSKNGDRVIHFHHPVWREDVDDKETTARIK